MYQYVKDFAGPFATIVAAIAAVSVTWYFARQQTKIAQEQADVAKQKLHHDILAIITLTQQNLSGTVLKRDRPVNFQFGKPFGPSLIRIGPPIYRWCCQRVPPAREALE